MEKSDKIYYCSNCKHLPILHTKTGKVIFKKCANRSNSTTCNSIDSISNRTDKLLEDMKSLDINGFIKEEKEEEEIIYNSNLEKDIKNKEITKEYIENLREEITQAKTYNNTLIDKLEKYIKEMQTELEKIIKFKDNKKRECENIYNFFESQLLTNDIIGDNKNLTNKKNLICYFNVNQVKQHFTEEIKGQINHIKSTFLKHFDSISNLNGIYSYFEAEYKVKPNQTETLKLFGDEFNESELKEKCHMIINGKLINFFKSFNIAESSSETYKLIIIMKPGQHLTTMKNIFNDCNDLVYVNFSHMDTSKVESMYKAFNNCVNLSSINLSGINTDSLTNLYCTFMNCCNISYLDLHSFNTNKVTNMSGLFGKCSSLANLELNFNNFNVENVEDMSCMFEDCDNLLELDLSSFNTTNVKSIQYMFHNCYSLRKIDLSSFGTFNVENCDYLFNNCYCLKELIYDKDSFSFFYDNNKSQIDENNIFNNCGLPKRYKNELLENEEEEEEECEYSKISI